jgi:hypothetical protein
MSSARPQRLSLQAKVRLALRIWASFILVRIGLRRTPFPEYVARLSQLRRTTSSRYPAATLSRAVDKSLRLGGRRPTCLVSALVLFRLLRAQGDPAELVIGLPEEANDHAAHAWVELAGADVGPPPGRSDHLGLARFG